MRTLRVYFHILGADTYYQTVSSPEEAKVVIDSIARFVNFQVDHHVFPDHCSTAGLEVWDTEEGDWVTWYDEDGLDLDEHFAEENIELRQRENLLQAVAGLEKFASGVLDSIHKDVKALLNHEQIKDLTDDEGEEL